MEEDEEEEEEDELSDEDSEPSPMKRPAATKGRPAAATRAAAAGLLTLPVHSHPRYTPVVEGQYILDAHEVSVASCSKTQHPEHRAFRLQIKKELDPKQFET